MTGLTFGSVAPLKSLYFHWIAIRSSSIVFTPRSLFLLFVLLFSGLIVEDLTTVATSPLTLEAITLVKHNDQYHRKQLLGRFHLRGHIE